MALIGNFFRFLNKTRRISSRKRRLLAFDAQFKNQQKIPEHCHRVLLIFSSGGHGDGLFVLGLAQRLYNYGIETAVLTSLSKREIFLNNPKLGAVFLFGDNSALDFSPDVIVDFEYTSLANYVQRLEFLRLANKPTVTFSELYQSLNLYSHFVCYSQTDHVSKRIALLLQTISHQQEKPIFPYAWCSEQDILFAKNLLEEKFGFKTKKFAYLNGEASKKNRQLSLEQMKALSDCLLEAGYDVIYNSEFTLPQKEGRLIRLPLIGFSQFIALVSFSSVVVTPDTSVSHIATYFDIPSFVIFPKNERDYWPKYATKDVWGGLSSKTLNFSVDNFDLHIDIFGFPNHRPAENKKYSPKLLSSELRSFLIGLK